MSVSQGSRLAVLMPFRNARDYILPAVESIRSQTHQQFTLFAIDDRSEDDTASLLSTLDDPRIRIVQSRRSGVAAALNTGLEACQGYSLVARHDADDISLPERFAQQFKFMASHPEIDFVATQAKRIDELGNYLRDFLWTPTRHSKLIAELKKTNPVCHGSVMFRTERVLAIGGYNEDYLLAQGYELWVRMAQAGCTLAALSECLYLYRTYDASWSRSQPGLRDEFIERVRRIAQESLP